MKDAASREFDENSPDCVIDLMPEQEGIEKKGGTMRLGAYPCVIAEGTQMRALYGSDSAHERHRHRFEYNNDYRKLLTEKGLLIGGVSPDGSLVEAVELPDKDFFVGVQFHPEFKSRPNRPHPLFLGLLQVAIQQKES